MSASKSPPPANATDTSEEPREALTFEAALAELEAIIDQIEQGRIGLEESLAAHRRGAVLIKRCRTILDGAEAELETLAPPDGDATDGKADAES
jgi:exodeoxyribonuclease VII small subunit